MICCLRHLRYLWCAIPQAILVCYAKYTGSHRCALTARSGMNTDLGRATSPFEAVGEVAERSRFRSFRRTIWCVLATCLFGPRCIADAGVRIGLPRQLAGSAAVQRYGAGKMFPKWQSSMVLRDQVIVCGTTIAGIVTVLWLVLSKMAKVRLARNELWNNFGRYL